ncbi:ribosome small subunit-dependent GTPase A [Candidatus Mycoplasma mahonii]|uniref:ribosome small subunit-dependent GTPase A n=1 Tax=Candidatus Mycoplasma mahonii TaxID=3004105 RepID=UPI0026EC7785|nr:ribosome small subunit-dependent GTPase A [Candidatus Mycoplasma mahonii]WKX02720.1 ribosome small subunit-dependent GTPase A [Candidatus Mycoplasma mahonii]
MEGQIIQILAGFYDIKSKGEIYRLRGSGKLRNSRIVPLVGDYVRFENNEMLTTILDRKNYLDRPKVANVDQVLIVISLVDPEYSSFMLNKFLSIIEDKNIKPIILFTKTDLSEVSYLEEYRSQGYDAHEISNKNGDGIQDIIGIFKGRLSVFTGQTGVGKTSTINSLAKTDFEVQEISKSLGRGKHTTRVTKIIPWFNGQLIDSPGFSSLEFNLTKHQLSRSFHDFRLYSALCKFSRSCSHDKEEDCEVKRQLKNGSISKQRYHDYLRLLKEVSDD